MGPLRRRYWQWTARLNHHTHLQTTVADYPINRRNNPRVTQCQFRLFQVCLSLFNISLALLNFALQDLEFIALRFQARLRFGGILPLRRDNWMWRYPCLPWKHNSFSAKFENGDTADAHTAEWLQQNSHRCETRQ